MAQDCKLFCGFDSHKRNSATQHTMSRESDVKLGTRFLNVNGESLGAQVPSVNPAMYSVKLKKYIFNIKLSIYIKGLVLTD